LIKQVVRHYSKTLDKNNLFNDNDLNFKLEIIYSEFLNEEKIVLEKIVKKDFNFTDLDKYSINYFLKTGLLKEKNKKYLINSSLLKKKIEEKFVKNYLIKLNKNNQILINGVIVDSFFSLKEKRLLKYLINNQEKIISRQKIGEIFWGITNNENFSDWALDQAIRRLRLKLLKLGLGKNLIKTIKNQGFKLSVNL
jgi:DNA-binding winged helix-turn-helix (wHTH) protein